MTTTNSPRLTDARLRSAPAAVLVEHVYAPALEVELGMFDAHLMVDLAHVTMLAEGKLIPSTVASQVLASLRDLRETGPGALEIDYPSGSLQLQVEAYLYGTCGPDAAGYLQLGRSRIDQGAAVTRLFLRGGVLDLSKQLVDFNTLLCGVATEHVESLMPGYTHLQHAQPSTFGHYIEGNVEIGIRDIDRLMEAMARIDRSALGAAALTGTSWNLDRKRTAALLGHPVLVRNARDGGMFAIDEVAELAAVLALVMSNVGRMASDIYLWATPEFGYLDIDDSLCGTSSAMPQKKNPNALERVKAIAGEAVGWQASQLGLLRLSSSTDADMAFASGLVGAHLAQTASAISLLSATVSSLVVHRGKMLDRLRRSWCTGSELADLLVRDAQLSFRKAHAVVARLVRESIDADRLPTDVTGEDVARLVSAETGVPLEISTETVQRALDPTNYPHTRRTSGSVAPREIRRLIREASGDLRSRRAQLDQRSRRIADAGQMLQAAISTAIGDVV